MAKKIIPFSFYPRHWGLRGKSKELALIDFYYEGLEADIKRAEINYVTRYELENAINEIKLNHNVIDVFQFEINKIQIDLDNAVIIKKDVPFKTLNVQLKYEKIDQQTYDKEVVELISDEDKKYIAALEYSLKYDEITKKEYEKEIASFSKEPWFSFDFEFDADNNDIIMMFDYNEYFWKKLRNEGHPGNDEHEIIDNFIKDWGRKLATEDYNGDYDTKLTSLNDEMNAQTGSTDTGLKIYE